MPTVSLRLTEDELAALKNWAHDSRRSLQKEIVFRLFADKGVLDVVRKHVVREVEGRLPERGAIGEPQPQARSGEDGAAERTRSGSCPMSPPRGTKCKVCGKVHPL